MLFLILPLIFLFFPLFAQNEKPGCKDHPRFTRFDVDKADIKPESKPAIREIAKLLRENKGLKLYVVGHTDNFGTFDYNMKISKARADEVTKEPITKYKISPDRLKAYGLGCLAPVATNKIDEGHAKNRRVELAEQ